MSRESALRPLRHRGRSLSALGRGQTRARVIGPAELLVVEFASGAGCDCDDALESGSSTTVEVLLPL